MRRQLKTGLSVLGGRTPAAGLTPLVDHRFGYVNVTPEHAYTWGIPALRMGPALRAQPRSATTGELGRSLPGQDPVLRLHVRRGSDPLCTSKVEPRGGLLAKRAPGDFGGLAQRAGASA